jgi:glycosyltransferase involved in cell wall biosynthesis
LNILSVVIPVYYEKDTVVEILRRVEASPVSGLRKEIVLVDDCSTDGTRDLLRKEVEPRPGVRVLYHDRNRGKGAALRTGISHTTGDVVLIQDADLEYDPREYPKLLAPIRTAPDSTGARPSGFSSSGTPWGTGFSPRFPTCLRIST